MASPAGLSGQFGYVSESTVGTAVTVTKFLPYTTESVKQAIARIHSKGIRAGRRTQTVWRPGAKMCSGTVSMELQNKDIAALLKHCFGGVSTAGSNPYTHTLTPGDLTGKSFTMQLGRPDTTGTVQPFTYAGTKVQSWTLHAANNEFVMLDLDVVAMSETTATALATASYAATPSYFDYFDATLSIAGSTINVVNWSIKGANTLKADRIRSGSQTVKEQLEGGQRIYTGTLAADFESLTQYNRFVNANEAALVITIVNGADSLTITCNVEFDGETPAVGNIDDLTGLNIPFTVLSATSDAAAITAVLVNTDASAA